MVLEEILGIIVAIIIVTFFAILFVWIWKKTKKDKTKKDKTKREESNMRWWNWVGLFCLNI